MGSRAVLGRELRSGGGTKKTVRTMKLTVRRLLDTTVNGRGVLHRRTELMASSRPATSTARLPVPVAVRCLSGSSLLGSDAAEEASGDGEMINGVS